MIKHRIEVAGGKNNNWFLDDSIMKIHKNTQGYPRKITQLCHQALLAMMGENKNIIDEDMVSRVIAGKINHGGLLRQKKKKENKIAVNKLLDVLQKDDKKTEPNFEIDDDDWIGATKNKVDARRGTADSRRKSEGDTVTPEATKKDVGSKPPAAPAPKQNRVTAKGTTNVIG